MLQEMPAQYAANKRIGEIIYCIRNGKPYYKMKPLATYGFAFGIHHIGNRI
jgi:hypothetical protein